jgi:hypothetical protein
MKLKELAEKFDLNLIDLRREMQKQIDFRIYHQNDLSNFDIEKVESFIIEHYLDDQDEDEQEEDVPQFDKDEFEKDFNGPLEDLLQKYNTLQIKYRAELFELKISSELAVLLDYLESTSRYSLVNALPEVDPFSPDEILQAKKSQFEYSLKRNNISEDNEESWDYQVTLMWLAAELSFEKICRREKMKVKDLNKENPASKQDFEIKGKSIDVKSRCRIGSSIDRNLDRTTCDPNEIIAFFNCESHQYKSEVKAKFLGIFDPALIDSLNLKYVHIDTTRFINPLFFVNHKAYFGFTSYNQLPYLNTDILKTIIKIREFELSKCLVFYDRTSIVESLIQIGYFKGHEDFAKQIKKLSADRKEFLGPTILFDYITGLIKQKKSVDTIIIKDRLLNFCCLNDMQYEYVIHYLNVLNILQDERNVCQFTQIPLNKCKINFSDDFKSIYAQSPIAKYNQSNTLMSYSWLTGDIISYKTDGTVPCTYENCGCLVHIHDWNKRIGKKSCRLHGKKIFPLTEKSV